MGHKTKQITTETIGEHMVISTFTNTLSRRTYERALFHLLGKKMEAQVNGNL